MYKQNSDAWQLDSREVQKIKNGILKYISTQQVPKPKERFTQAPESKTLGRSMSPKLSRRTSRPDPSPHGSTASSIHLEINTLKTSRVVKHDVSKMPKGFLVDNVGRIKREGNYATLQVVHSEEPQKPMQATQIQAEPAQTLPVFDKKMGSSLIIHRQEENEIEQSIAQQMVEQVPQLVPMVGSTQLALGQPAPAEVVPTQIKEEKPILVEQVQIVSSVFEIARRFGQTVNSKPSQLNKPAASEKLNIFQSSKNEPLLKVASSKAESADNVSLASFGKGERRAFPQRKKTLEDFLDAKQASIDETSTEKRRRATTMQFKTSGPDYKQEPTANNLPFRTAQKQEKTQPTVKQLVKILFTEQDEKQLRSRYEALTTKLQNLKRKVIQENKQAKQSIQTSKKYDHQREATALYHKYSPLRTFQRIQERKLVVAKMEERKRMSSPRTPKANPSPRSLFGKIRNNKGSDGFNSYDERRGISTVRVS